MTPDDPIERLVGSVERCASDPDAILICASCGHADVDFEVRAEHLVRCSFCAVFNELTRTVEFNASDSDLPRVLELRGNVYSPSPPRSRRSNQLSRRDAA